VVTAQPAGRIPRIGWLTSSTVHAPNVNALRDGMRSLGDAEIRLDVRAADGRTDRLAALAAELVALKVDVIITDGGPAATAAKEATTTTPIVIGAATTDFLMRQKLVASLARPGANVTGFTISPGPELGGKRLELLREAVPNLSRVLVVWNPTNDGARWPCRLSSRRPGIWSPGPAPCRVGHRATGASSAGCRNEGGDGDAHRRRRFPVEPARARRRSGSSVSAASDVPRARVRHGWWVDGVREHRVGELPTRGGIRRSDSQGGQTRRPSRRTTDNVRVRDQPENRQDARPDDPAVAAGADLVID